MLKVEQLIENEIKAELGNRTITNDIELEDFMMDFHSDNVPHDCSYSVYLKDGELKVNVFKL